MKFQKMKLKDKISKNDFFNFINMLNNNYDMTNDIYAASNRTIDLINYDDEINKPYMFIVERFFSEIEWDCITWYVYEYRKGDMKIYDSKNGKVIADLETDEDLWNYLNTLKETKTKKPINVFGDCHLAQELMDFIKQNGAK